VRISRIYLEGDGAQLDSAYYRLVRWLSCSVDQWHLPGG
jgi:hypothetical protein